MNEVYKFMSGGLKEDRALMIDICSADPSRLYWVPDGVRKDRDFNLAVVKENAKAVRSLHTSLKDDRELFDVAVQSDPSLIEFASHSLAAELNDLDFTMKRVRADGCGLG